MNVPEIDYVFKTKWQNAAIFQILFYCYPNEGAQAIKKCLKGSINRFILRLSRCARQWKIGVIIFSSNDKKEENNKKNWMRSTKTSKFLRHFQPK